MSSLHVQTGAPSWQKSRQREANRDYRQMAPLRMQLLLQNKCVQGR